MKFEGKKIYKIYKEKKKKNIESNCMWCNLRCIDLDLDALQLLVYEMCKS